MANQSKTTLIMRSFENVLFVAALLLSLPPMPSDEAFPPHFFPGRLIAPTLFFISKILATKRGAEHPVLALFQSIVFLVYGIGVYWVSLIF